VSYQLVAEVLDHAPAMTAAERLVLVGIAERARTNTRECELDMPTLQRRAGGLDASNVRAALRRLAERGIEVRVAAGKDRRGRPVFAYRGQAPRYRLPSFPAPYGCRCDLCRNLHESAVDNGSQPRIRDGSRSIRWRGRTTAPAARSGRQLRARVFDAPRHVCHEVRRPVPDAHYLAVLCPRGSAEAELAPRCVIFPGHGLRVCGCGHDTQLYVFACGHTRGYLVATREEQRRPHGNAVTSARHHEGMRV
jgi:hypothetical protein